MSALNKFADYTLGLFSASADDEYHEQVLLKSQAVGMNTLGLTTIPVGAVLAWLLPGWATFCSFLVVLPLIVANGVTDAWVKQYAPRMSAINSPKYMTIPLIALVAWLAGIGYQFSSVGGPQYAVIIGGVVGAVVALATVPVSMRRNKHADQRRLDNELDAAELQ